LLRCICALLWHKAADRCSAEIWSLSERSGHRASRLRSLPLPGILHRARGYSPRQLFANAAIAASRDAQ
jgi:hypothetical protein